MSGQPLAPPRVAATVLTGFLGSGKTTLLNYLLSVEHGMKVAVIINEVGAVGIDGKVVSGGEQFVELDNGCLCCALNADLDRLLRELRARGGFDHLVVETTGLADPLPIAWMFSRPGLSDFYRLDAIVTVVDAPHLEQALATAPEARVQLERADIVVVNKLDLVSDGGALAIARVRELNELAPLVEATHGRVPWPLLLGAESQEPAPRRLAVHALHEAGPSLTSFVFTTDAVLDDDALDDFVAGLPPDIYRIKGLVRARGEAPWLLLNAVAGRIDLRPCRPEREPEHGAVVFIGAALDVAALRALCEAALR